MEEQYEVTPSEAQSLLGKDHRAVLIDVREPEEVALARIEGALLVPMQSIPPEVQRLEQIADENTLLVLCHHGVRSLQVVAWLRRQGIEDCYSVAGGIDRWSQEVDASVARY